MALSDTTKTDRLFKGSQGRRMTSSDKAYYEENAGNLRVILGEEVWLEDIDFDPNTAISDNVAWMESGWMHEDSTVASEKSWFASGGSRGDWTGWIPPKCGQDYTIKIYQSGSGDGNLGSKITDANLGAYGGVFDYQAGVLWWQDSHSYTTPFYISGYRYSGLKVKKSTLDEQYQASGTGGSTGWSGASGFYTISSNYIGHSSNKLIHAPSSNLKTWFDTVYEPLGASGTAWSGASDFYGFSSNTKLLYHPSGYVVSGQEYSQAYNWFSESSSKLTTISGSLSTRITTLEGQDEFDHELYITSANALSSFANSSNIQSKFILSNSYNASGAFYPSSLGKALMDFSSNASNLYAPIDGSGSSWSGAAEYIGHSSNAAVHVSTTENSNWNSAYSHITSDGSSHSDVVTNTNNITDLFSWSSNTQSLYHPSGFVISGAEYSQAYASSQLLKDPAFADFGTGTGDVAEGDHTHTNYDNLGEVSWTVPTAGEGISLDGTTGKVSGSLTIKVDDYIASSVAISKFPNSSSLLGKYYPSALGKKALASAQTAMFTIQDGITSWDSEAYINSGIQWDGTNWIAMASGGSGGEGSSEWTKRTGGIYYGNEVTIGHSNFDLGNYKFQVSGDSYFSGNVVFKGSTFSGLAQPTFNSGVANKAYVDQNSYPSSLGKSLMDFSSNTNLTASGFDSVSDGGTIAHGLPRLPTYANITPSGNIVNFGATCKVDATNITVYLTIGGSRDVFWTASC